MRGELEGEHPDPRLLERFMRAEAGGMERRNVVRHLLARCPRCVSVTQRLWSLGNLQSGEDGPFPGPLALQAESAPAVD